MEGARHEPLDQLAEHYGIEADYYDIYGNRHIIGAETKRALLAAMGVPATSDEEIGAALQELSRRRWSRPCDPILVRRHQTADTWVVRAPSDALEDERVGFEWTIVDERGNARPGRVDGGIRPVDAAVVDGRRYAAFQLPLPADLTLGYYRLTVTVLSPSERVTASTQLAVVPHRCHAPDPEDARRWGFALQLYALQSPDNWGVGDFRDLREWAEWAARDLGAHLIGLNPVHALRNSRPYHVSPYSPDSRLYLNPLYIAIPACVEWHECREAQDLLATADFRNQLESFRKADTIDYEGIAAAKRRMLELLFATFERRHVRLTRETARARTDRGRAFEEFLVTEGQPLERFALFQALAESEVTGRTHVWQQWPEPYRDPTSAACREFLRVHRRRVRFHQYVQWVAHEQLSRVAARTRELNMPVGLYHDLALGSDRSGSDAWVFQSVLALDADAGCPPDAFAPEGQNWGLPPVDPHKLRNSGYAMFIDLVRHNLRYGGALRLDHVMALFRLFWIPRGMPGSAGAYVRYPVEDLLGILALESVRHRAMIVGEDLGTVPDFVRERLDEAGVLSYRVFYFERRHDGEWKTPNEYPPSALAVVTTHDLPTLAGFWSHADIDARIRLGLYPQESAQRMALDERVRDKAGILRALRQEGLLPAGTDEGALLQGPMTTELAEAIHAYVARTPSRLMLATVEDLLGEVDQVNLPGTLDAYPNWSHKLSVSLADARAADRPQRLASALGTNRP